MAKSEIEKWEARLCEAGHRPDRMSYGEVRVISILPDGREGSQCLACGQTWPWEDGRMGPAHVVVDPCPGTEPEAESLPPWTAVDFSKPIVFVANGEVALVWEYLPAHLAWRVGIQRGYGSFCDREPLKYLDAISAHSYQIDVDGYGRALGHPDVHVVKNA